MSVKVHNKQGKVICEIGIDRETDYPLNIEEWAWNTAQHIADENKKRSEAEGERFAKEIGEQLAKKRGNPGWWEKLKRSVTGHPRSFSIPITTFEDYRCPTCLCDTIQPVSVVGPLLAIGFSPGHELAGYACQNLDCPMHDVVIPKILVDRIDEKP